jgi:cysteine synthase A
MTRPAFETEIVDRATRDRTVALFRERRIVLPTLGELADPTTIPAAHDAALAAAAPDDAAPANLFRVHWHNGSDRRTRVAVPEHVVLPPALTGVASPIIVAFGDRFPMITAHKVLAAYGCLVPRLVTGQFDPTPHRAVWPSTGNYCRGGVAISRILGCRGVAVLPEGMSAERFRWLERWVADPGDIVRTVGTESNVKEIYDACARSIATRQRHLQPVLRVREPPGPLHRDRAGAGAGVRPPPPPPAPACGWPRSSRPPARPARSAPATT